MEPHLFLAWIDMIKLMPSMINKRRRIMAKAKVTADEMRQWFK
jgi:hypothetical protein